jgi:uncharacterized membrane protein YphA (DoxX/SURF4 family)
VTPAQKSSKADILALLARWWLGAVFIYMGLNKAVQPEMFLKLVRQYDVVTNPWLLNGIAATLPWFEVVCGLLLVTGIAVRGAALMLVTMLVPFTLLIIHRTLMIASAQDIAFCAIRFDCGCGNGEVLICRKLVENALMIVFSCWLMSRPGNPLCLRYGIFQGTRQPA